jgi:hypothetical protein
MPRRRGGHFELASWGRTWLRPTGFLVSYGFDGRQDQASQPLSVLAQIVGG